MSGFPNRKSFARGLKAGNSNARGFDLEDIANLPRLSTLGSSVGTKKGILVHFLRHPAELRAKRAESRGRLGAVHTRDPVRRNPNPVKWSVLAGLGGNNLLAGRENHRWGIGFFHFGLTEPLLAGLAALEVKPTQRKGGVEAFYNLAITPWLRLSGDLQVIAPWDPSKSQATYMALRLQTKF